MGCGVCINGLIELQEDATKGEFGGAVMMSMMLREQILNCLQMDYALDIATLEHLPLGADLDAAVYKAEAADQTHYFVKVKRTYNQNMSITITKLLHEMGIEHVILPIKDVRGHDFQLIENATVVVYPFIEG